MMFMIARFSKFSFVLARGNRVRVLSWFIVLGILSLILFFSGVFGVFRGGNQVRQHDTAIEVQDLANPAVKNNLDLVKYAQNALKYSWGYLYGTYGQVLDQPLLDSRERAYPSEVTPYLNFIHNNWVGGRVTDCAGLIKGYGWFDPSTGNINYGTNGMPDLCADEMYRTAPEKGDISSMPEIPGLAVWMNGHVGIYVGKGEAIEAMTTTRGVVRTKLWGRGWLAWFKIPAIQYL